MRPGFASYMLVLLFPVAARSAFYSSLPKRRLLFTARWTSSNSRQSNEKAEQVLLERGGRKAWQRLKHLVDLADTKGGIVDVGTDHGLLAVALAVSGRYDRVLGVDVSDRALKDGALRLQQEINDFCGDKEELAPLTFRVGDGLQVAQAGEADAVCIAGMGVNSMIQILEAKDEDRKLLLLDTLQSQHLILQPTNSRPRNLMLLYSRLSDLGWSVEDERIEYLSSRWYLSALFRRSQKGNTEDPRLPGERLLLREHNGHSSLGKTFCEYIKHHCKWIRRDRQIPTGSGEQPESDDKWLYTFESILKQSEKS